MEPLGIRNCNPGNIRGSHTKWRGQIGVGKEGFCIFETAAYGLRAMAICLVGYQQNHELNTITGIINRWAPSSENDVAAYVNDVSRRSGFSPSEALNLGMVEVLAKLMAAMVWHENGKQPYNDATLVTAARSGINYWTGE